MWKMRKTRKTSSSTRLPEPSIHCEIQNELDEIPQDGTKLLEPLIPSTRSAPLTHYKYIQIVVQYFCISCLTPLQQSLHGYTDCSLSAIVTANDAVFWIEKCMQPTNCLLMKFCILPVSIKKWHFSAFQKSPLMICIGDSLDNPWIAISSMSSSLACSSSPSHSSSASHLIEIIVVNLVMQYDVNQAIMR